MEFRRVLFRSLFDIIEIDQDTIREKRKEVELLKETSKIEKLLHDIVFSENRMLLVTRGLDPRTDDDVYNGFEKEFIAADIIPQKFKILTDKARNNESLIAYKPLIDELADLLNDLYQNMDDSLQFKLPAEKASAKQVPEEKDSKEKTSVEQVSEEKNSEEKAPAEQVSEEKNSEEKASAEEESENIVPDVKKDFRGVMCPMNFVKTKIALTPDRKSVGRERVC